MRVENKADSSSVVVRIGEALRQRREAIGLDIAQLAREAHVSRTTLHHLEDGKTKKPSTSVLKKLLDALDAAEAESGVTQVVPSEAPNVEMIEFEVAGDFGVKVVVRGPVSEHETLRADVSEIIRSIREGDAKSPE
jgi:transcriptional regulator with XRE-family HTH domain